MNWTTEQLDVFDWFEHGNGNLLVVARAGSAKCLGLGTPVMMFDTSIKPVERVVVGDKLMGPDSRPRRVGTVNLGRGPLYRVTPIKGDPWVCNDEHVMTLTGTYRDLGNVIDIPLRDLIEREARRTTTGRVDRKWKLFRVPLQFESQNVPVDPYLVGLWLGDGTTGEPEITGSDPEIIAYCTEIASRYGAELVVRFDPRCNTNNLRFRVGKRGAAGRHTPHLLRRFFADLSEPHKHISPGYLRNGAEVRLGLLAGLLDTDGTYDTGVYSITTKYRKLADQIVFLARSLGFAAYASQMVGTIRNLDFEGIYWRVGISGDLDRIPCRVERKRAHPREQIKRVLVTGFSVEAVGDGDYYGFTLDGDGRFLLGDFTVTHNTTSLLHGAAKAGEKLKLVTAFNKRIADELVAKAPEGVMARTLHSLGLGYLRRRSTAVEVDKWRGRNLIRKAWGELKAENPTFPEGDSEYNKLIAKLVSLGKSVTPFATDWREFVDLGIAYNVAPAQVVVDQTGITLEHMAIVAFRAMTLAHETYKDRIDFDDMIFIPLRKGWVTPAFDLICGDESQDMGPGQLELVMRALKPDGRFCAVLDPEQCIYQFAGADSNIVAKLRERFNPVELSLTTSFRCAREIVKQAQRYVPDIKAMDGAQEGTVVGADARAIASLAQDGDFILSRTNAALLETRLHLLAKGRQATIIGAEEFGTAVKNIVHAIWETLDDQSTEAFDVALNEWRDDEKGEIDDMGDPRTAWVDDIYQAICVLSDTSKNGAPAEFIFEIATRIEQAFSGDGHGIELSTVHKAKGREADRVFILGETFPDISEDSDHARCICGSPKWAHDRGEIRALPRCNRVFIPDREWNAAERNVRYVAITRARRELYYVGRAI